MKKTIFLASALLFSGLSESANVVDDDILDFLPGIIAAANYEPPPPPLAPPGVSLLSTYTSKRDSLGKLFIVGEIYNNTSSSIWLTSIVANVYDQGQFVLSDEAHVYRDIMPPQTTSCFTMYTVYTGPFTVVSFQPVTYSRTTEQTVNLPISGVNTVPDLVGGLKLSGQIRNTTGKTIEFTKAVGTFYNSKGKVIECEVGFTNSSKLSPNQASGFTMGVSVAPASLANYTLQSDYQ